MGSFNATQVSVNGNITYTAQFIGNHEGQRIFPFGDQGIETNQRKWSYLEINTHKRKGSNCYLVSFVVCHSQPAGLLTGTIYTYM